MMSYLLALIMCHMLLTDVHLADKIMKTEWDTSGDGAQVVAGAEGLEDLIPTNRWLKRVVLPGKVEFMRMPLGAGRKPRHYAEDRPRRGCTGTYQVLCADH